MKQTRRGERHALDIELATDQYKMIDVIKRIRQLAPTRER